MSELPTPETDKNCGWALTSHYGRSEGKYLATDKEGPFVHANFARKLERERDEAREALAEEIKHHIETTEKWNGHHFDLTIALSDLNKTLRERDEALSRCADLAHQILLNKLKEGAK